MHEADLDLAVAQLLHHVVELVRELGRDERELRQLAPSLARERARRQALAQQRARVRPRDLEHVEVLVELDPDGAERRDRLVEEHEARRQLQVHRVDELEAPRG